MLLERLRASHDDGGVICENAHEALVSPEIFERAQRSIRERRPVPTAPTPGKYLLTGLMYFADTGRRLQGFTKSHSRRKIVRRNYG